MKPLEKMRKSELIEVLEITARRHEALKAIVDKVHIKEFKESVRRFCPGPAFKKTATNQKICLESGNDEAN